MLCLIALIFSALFVYFCRGMLKKYPYAFYIGAAVITAAVASGDYSSLPLWVNRYVIGLFSKGALGTSLFIIVMYTGALKNGTKRIAELMKIRGELSIFAAILVLAHNAVYGRVYFKMLFTRPQALPANQLAAAVVSLFLIADMVVLTITSFPQIRRKMKAKTWKNLQRTAYPFYGLIYVHILLIHMPLARKGLQASLLNILVYSILFISYGVMRIRKYVLTKNKAKLAENPQFARQINIAAGVAGIVLFLIVFVPSAIGNVMQHKAVISQNAAEQDSAKETKGAAEQKNGETTGGERTAENQPVQQTEAVTGNGEDGTEKTVQEAEGIDVQENTEPAGANNILEQNDDGEKTDAKQNAPAEEAAAKAPVSEPAPTKANRTYKADGDYMGTAVCDVYGYEVTVKVSIADDKISNIAVNTDASALDADYADRAINGLKRKLVSNQGSAGLDAVSGATYSSNAIFKAFNNAVAAAK